MEGGNLGFFSTNGRRLWATDRRPGQSTARAHWRQDDPAAGKVQAARCIICHKIDGVGIDYGPDLRNWTSNQGKEAFYTAVTHPSDSIAHGYAGTAITLTNGDVIEGLVFGKTGPVIIVSTGGVEQMVPQSRIKRMKKLRKKSLMLSADQLGFTANQLVDLAAIPGNLRGPSAPMSPTADKLDTTRRRPFPPTTRKSPELGPCPTNRGNQFFRKKSARTRTKRRPPAKSLCKFR